MCCVALSVFLLLAADALFKYSSNHFQSLPSSITQRTCHHQAWYGEKHNRLFIFLRGFFLFCDEYFYFRGVLLLSLGNLEAIYGVSPIFVAFAGRILFKETFSKCFPVVFIFTLSGLTVLCQPTWLITWLGTNATHEPNDVNPLGVVFIIIACVGWTLMSVMVKMTSDAHWIQFELVSSLQVCVIWV
eukprot:448283_1